MRGSKQRGEPNYNGCSVVRGPSVGVVGWRTLIVGPHTTATIVNNNNYHHGGGALCPPIRSVPSHQMPLIIVNVSGHGQRRQHEGFWGVVVHVVEEAEVHAFVLVCLIQPGVDNGSNVIGHGIMAGNIAC